MKVRELTTQLGPYRAAGQFQQRPTPLGGLIIQRTWFQYWNEATIPPKFDEIVLSVDMNFGDTKSKEPSHVPPKTLEQLEAQGYRFPTLPAPFSQEELHAVVFGQSRAWWTTDPK
jgi:hypothetical protein